MEDPAATSRSPYFSCSIMRACDIRGSSTNTLPRGASVAIGFQQAPKHPNGSEVSTVPP
jgi:hypothetical protein